MKVKVVNAKAWFVIFIAIFALSYLVSCKKDPKCDDPSYVYLAFDKKDTTLLPYTDRDTLYFQYKVNNLIIDTFTFVGNGKVKGKERLPTGHLDESCRKLIEGETFEITFGGIDTNIFLGFSLRIENSGTSKVYNKLGINFNSVLFFGGSIDFDGSYGYSYPSLNLNGLEYYNAGVMYKGSSYNDINTDDKKNVIILNSEFGVLQIMLDSTIFWNRVDR